MGSRPVFVFCRDYPIRLAVLIVMVIVAIVVFIVVAITVSEALVAVVAPRGPRVNLGTACKTSPRAG